MPRIPVETKHIYKTYEADIVGNIRTDSVVQPIANFRSIVPNYPVQGTDENNRIGRKIRLEFISEEGTISVSNFTTENSLLDYWTGYLQQSMINLQPNNFEFPVNNLGIQIKLRHMYVYFYDEEFYNGTDLERGMYLSDWYKQLVIQTFADPSVVPSIETDTKRESTPYTGKFRILYEHFYTFTLGDQSTYRYQDRLNIKKLINFEAEGSDPTNFHLFSIWIGPINPLTDYGNRSFGVFLVDTPEIIQPPSVAIVNSTIKVSYTDI